MVKLRFLVILLALIMHPDSRANDWAFTINPYIQATTIEGDAALGRVAADDVVLDFDTILDTLDTGAMINFSGVHQSNFGFIIDYAFMDLNDDISIPLNGIVSLRVRQAVLQVEALYQKKHAAGTLDYLVGIRWWDNDFDVDLAFNPLSQDLSFRDDEDWVDVFIGARWSAPLTKKWSYTLRGDVGMGGSDFTSSVEGGVFYHFNKQNQLDIKYKATYVDLDKGDTGQPSHFKYDTVTHGPVIGYQYHF